MFNTFRDWIASEVQTVETIVSGWINTVQQLEQHAVDKAEEVLFHNSVVDAAYDAAQVAQAEADKAKAIAAKIKSILA